MYLDTSNSYVKVNNYEVKGSGDLPIFYRFDSYELILLNLEGSKSTPQMNNLLSKQRSVCFHIHILEL